MSKILRSTIPFAFALVGMASSPSEAKAETFRCQSPGGDRIGFINTRPTSVRDVSFALQISDASLITDKNSKGYRVAFSALAELNLPAARTAIQAFCNYGTLPSSFAQVANIKADDSHNVETFMCYKEGRVGNLSRRSGVIRFTMGEINHSSQLRVTSESSRWSGAFSERVRALEEHCGL